MCTTVSFIPWCFCLRHPVFYREAHSRPACQVSKQVCLWANTQVITKSLLFTSSQLQWITQSHIRLISIWQSQVYLPPVIQMGQRACGDTRVQVHSHFRVAFWLMLWRKAIKSWLNVGLCRTNSAWPSCRSSGYYLSAAICCYQLCQVQHCSSDIINTIVWRVRATANIGPSCSPLYTFCTPAMCCIAQLCKFT